MCLQRARRMQMWPRLLFQSGEQLSCATSDQCQRWSLVKSALTVVSGQNLPVEVRCTGSWLADRILYPMRHLFLSARRLNLLSELTDKHIFLPRRDTQRLSVRPVQPCFFTNGHEQGSGSRQRETVHCRERWRKSRPVLQ